MHMKLLLSPSTYIVWYTMFLGIYWGSWNVFLVNKGGTAVFIIFKEYFVAYKTGNKGWELFGKVDFIAANSGEKLSVHP